MFGHGSEIAWARRLRLGGWHVNHALNVIDARGRVHRVVLRRWARSGWEADDPDYTVQREVRVLQLLQSTAIPAPALIAADPAGERCDVPAVLLTRLAGHPPARADTESDGFCRQLAETLAAIHDIGAGTQSRLAWTPTGCITTALRPRPPAGCLRPRPGATQSPPYANRRRGPR